MAYIEYKDINFKYRTKAIIDMARAICQQYARQGYDLTLRQLYYQFIARDAFPNTEKSYKMLGSIINDARIGGELDWDWLTDRGRDIDARSHWSSATQFVRSVAPQLHIDFWEDQNVHLEVWVEKQALAGVVERVCRGFDVTSLACKGYLSQSEMHVAAMRLLSKIKDGKRIQILHLGDHDPSGKDMSRDNESRLRAFIGHHLAEDYAVYRDQDKQENPTTSWIYDWGQFTSLVEEDHDVDFDGAELLDVDRIALNMDQVRQYNPPPNYAKITDSRAAGYIAEFGQNSWELDALPPDVLSTLITDRIGVHIDFTKYQARQRREDLYKRKISELIAAHGDMLEVTEDELTNTEEES